MKIVEFIKYITKSTVEQVYNDFSELFEVVTKQKTWVFICFIFMIVSFFLKQLNLIILGIILFLFFFVTYQWQVFNEEYTHEQREKYWKKPKK